MRPASSFEPMDNSNKKAQPGEALKRDWEQTKHDFKKNSGRELNQDVDDTLGQAVGTRETPPRNVPSSELDKK